MAAMKDVSVIESWEIAAALLDPVRQLLLQHLGAPATAASIARGLGLPRQRIGYHIRELERHGLIEQVAERKRGNCMERVIQATARRYIISPAALGQLGAEPGQITDAMSASYLIATAAQTIRDVSGMQERARAAEKQLPTMTIQVDVRFETPSARAAFVDELAAYVADAIQRHHAPDAAQGRDYRFTIAGYPTPAQPRESE
jgi:DNA-binding transcriptional ArsR family regulator